MTQHPPQSILRIATRSSKLALTQTTWVANHLQQRNDHLRVELVEIASAGDRDAHSDISQLEVGAFTKSLQSAVLAGQAECAVHSLKDLPTLEPDGLTIAAIPPREDWRDALVSNGNLTLEELAPGAKVGTSSPRRALQLLLRRPDLKILPIRGNVDTRLTKLDSQQFDAVVLAVAGLNRLSRASVISEILDILPAPGQGALALECRSDDAATVDILQSLHDPATAHLVTTERAWLHACGAGCRSAAAALATLGHTSSQVRLDWFHTGASGTVSGPIEASVELAAGAARDALAQQV